jgi:DNA-binding CsgD family transcriptional regulator
MDFARTLLGDQCHGLGSFRCLQYPVAAVSQDCGSHSPNGRLILDQQNRFAAVSQSALAGYPRQVDRKGYLLKDSPQEALIDAVCEVARGGTVLSPDVASKVIENLAEASESGRPKRISELTVREIEILEMLYQGMRNAAIGDRLEISTRTVEAHVGNVISKLGAQNRTEAVQIALQNKIIR